MASLAEAAQILLGFKTEFDGKIGAPFKQQAAALLGKFRQELLAVCCRPNIACCANFAPRLKT